MKKPNNKALAILKRYRLRREEAKLTEAEATRYDQPGINNHLVPLLHLPKGSRLRVTLPPKK